MMPSFRERSHRTKPELRHTGMPTSHESELLLPEEEKETFKTINSMYTNGLVWSDEWAEKALEWLKSPDSRDSINADMTVGGRRLLVNMDDKALWQKILESFRSEGRTT
nr:unnamed protein product [Haemonchus contortus]